MGVRLSDVEQRVLGVLIEKSLTQPAGYPMTINALVLGANQRQNRDPVTAYSDTDVSRALHSLSLKQLVRQAPPGPGARANRFEHNVVEACQWDRRDQAVLAELLLRGRQTAGELRGRAARMTAFPDLASVTTTLEALARREPRLVEELPREPGRSANRFRHLLSTAPPPTPADGVVHGTVLSQPVSGLAPQSGLAGPQGGLASPQGGLVPQSGFVMPSTAPTSRKAGLSTSPQLEQRVARLEEQVRTLTERFDAIQPARRVCPPEEKSPIDAPSPRGGLV
jgi:hypothetical protein